MENASIPEYSIGSLLIVVHPGSALGSADFNIGVAAAQSYRRKLIFEMDLWQGQVLVLHNELSSEISGRHEFAKVLRRLEDRAATKISGMAGGGIVAEDQRAAILEWFSDVALPRDLKIVVTGAWYHPANDGGCVNDVYDTLKDLGYTACRISENAINIDAQFPETDFQTDMRM